MLLSMKNHTDTLIEQTKIRPQETLDFVMSRQMGVFLFNPPINLVEEGKCLLTVTSFEATNSVFNITGENKSFSVSIPGHYNSQDGEELINKLNTILELRSEITCNIELHVKEVAKKVTK